MKRFFAVVALVGLLFSGCDNKYEYAQKATVILESDSSFGSGVTVQRVNPDWKVRTFVWTAAHVVRGCNTIKVRVIDRYQYQKVGEHDFVARVLARDSADDLALLEIVEAPAQYFHSVQFDRPLYERVGTQVFHVGNYHGPLFDGSVSTGIVSQSGAAPPETPWRTTDQTTAFIEHGSSGGGLFDERDSAVVGIVVGMVGPGIGFYVPIREIDRFAHVHHVAFALRGQDCPNDAALNSLAKSAHVAESPLTKAP